MALIQTIERMKQEGLVQREKLITLPEALRWIAAAYEAAKNSPAGAALFYPDRGDFILIRPETDCEIARVCIHSVKIDDESTYQIWALPELDSVR